MSGDSLSPFLFISVIEGLHAEMKYTIQAGELNGMTRRNFLFLMFLLSMMLIL